VQTTAAGASGQITTAGNISAGTFGSNTGGGTYTFPGYLYSAELLTNDNLYLGYLGDWMSNRLGQDVRSSASPTFSGATINGTVIVGGSPSNGENVKISGYNTNNNGTSYIYGVYGYAYNSSTGVNTGVVGVGRDIGVSGSGSSYGVYGKASAGSDFYGYGGEHTSGSSWVNGSSRDLKTDFTPVDDQAILTGIASLPMTKWVYKTDTKAWHIGPIAEDFYASFGLGDDNKSISTIDPSGIALVGIKALDEKMTTQQQEIDELKAQNATLSSEVQQLLKK
jgi:hypothetical protein